MSAVLPVQRPVARSHDPPRRADGALSAPEEAAPDGTFRRESFLRALVVQVAQAVERQEGPDAAEAAVARVGAGVGGRMEDEHRRAQHRRRLGPAGGAHGVGDPRRRFVVWLGGDRRGRWETAHQYAGG